MLQDPIEQSKIKRLNLTFFTLIPIISGLGWWLWGVDFGTGALVGCFVVGINLFISQRLVAKLLYDQSSKPLALLAYFFKIGLSVLILYIAVIKFKVDLMGVALGLSTIIISILISSLGATPREGHSSED